MTAPLSAADASSPSRREFLKQTTTAVVAGAVATGASQVASGAFAGGSDVLKVGLVGCGGRGSGAAVQALSADPQTKLVAVADAFADRLESSLREIKSSEVADRVEVDDDHKFVGFDAYKHVIDTCDVVLLATPPHFRPQHLRACVEAGRHTFVEKPVAVDAPGVRSVLESCELAGKKGLSVVSGLCWRYHAGIREAFNRLHNGEIGELVALECSYNSNGVWEPRVSRGQCSNEMEYQMRNWYYYTWLSGDFNVEQHVHSLDKLQWAMKDQPPVKASGSGGRSQRIDPQYGNIYDHFSITYEYPGGVKAFARCRHFRNCTNDVTDHFYGTNGVCHISGDDARIVGRSKASLASDVTTTGSDGARIASETKWRFRGRAKNMYQAEHDELFAAIRSGQPINNGLYMTYSSMLAILGRMVAYTGKELTWDEALASEEDLSPPAYDWVDIPRPDVAIPGVTPFV
ncbi:MAG TPA: Gfo/Idh/MocA family oxidoreductase [Planctomycetaceae bacterium]|nr:Gfo/Idh/MocA family oxidoreductase [Planctomycetaceae bacterium]